MANSMLQGIVRVAGGAGFVVTEDGFIATCAHVVKGLQVGDDVQVAFHATGEIVIAHVEILRAAEDVAILRLDTPLPIGVVPIQLGSSLQAKSRTFDTFGFPAAKPVEGMAGKCEVIGETTERGFRVLQLRASEITAGYSGAPVWDAQLQTVIGMVTSVAVQDDLGKQGETAFVIPVETLRDVCPTLRLPVACPYRGLQVFEREHADLYFGRETATQELLDALSRRDIVALVGVSGSGKSSLVRAGLEKGLREHAIPGLADRARCLMMPGRNPLLNLTLALADLESLTAANVTEALGLSEDGLAEGNRRQTAEMLDERSPQVFAEAVQACAPPEGLLLIVDQLERLYTECDNEAMRDHFINTLLAAAGGRVKVLLALRADYYGLALGHAGLEQVIKQGGQVTLGLMIETALCAAIEEPAKVLGRRLQPGLTGRLITDVRGRAGDLPLLEFALTELWERDNQKGVLTLASYKALGYKAPDGRYFPGVQGAIAQRAETVWQDLDDEEHQAARRVFLNLVTPGPLDKQGGRMTEDTSRRAWQAEWDETTQRVVRKMVNARLLTTGQDPVSDQPTVEVAHEALIRAWPRLQQWLAGYRPFVRWYNADLAPFLRRWLDKDRHFDFLLPRAVLAQAEYWLARYPEELTGPPAEYIQDSVALREQEREARERRRRQLTLASVGVAVVFLVLALLAWGQRNAFEEQRQIAIARQLAAQANLALERHLDSELSLLLALEAVHAVTEIGGSHVLEAEDMLRSTLAVAPLAVLRHEGRVINLAFSPNGERLASSGDDGTVRIMDTATGEELIFLDTWGTPVVFSPDGTMIATGGLDGFVRIWNAATGEQLLTLHHGADLPTIHFAQDAPVVITANLSDGDSENRVRYWDSATGEALVTLSREKGASDFFLSQDDMLQATLREDCQVHLSRPISEKQESVLRCDGEARVIIFSLDGSQLAVASDTGDVRLWSTTIGDEVVTFYHKDVQSIVFSPKGTEIATIDKDGDAHLWKSATGEQLATLNPLHSPIGKTAVQKIVFSQDGKRLIATGKEGIVCLRDAATGRELAVLQHTNAPGVRGTVIFHAAFSPDGKRLVTYGEDGTLHLVDTSDGNQVALLQTEGQIYRFSFSPDGSRIAIASEDSTPRLSIDRDTRGNFTRLVDASTGEELAVLCNDGTIWKLDFSSDGAQLAIASDDGTAILVDATTGEELGTLAHGGPVFKVAFSPNGRYLATGSADGTVRLWNAALHNEPAILQHEGSVQKVVFSSDASRLATVSEGGITHLWDVATGESLVSLHHEGSVRDIEFSSNGERMATASDDGTVRLVDAVTGDEVAVFRHTGHVWAVNFNPAGTQLATAEQDGSIRLVDAMTGEESAVLNLSDTGHVFDVAYNPAGTLLAAACSDGTVQLWDTATTERLVVLKQGHWPPILNVAFSADGSRLASASHNSVRLWDADTREVLAVLHEYQFPPPDLGPPASDIEFSEDGTLLATTSLDGTARLVDANTGKELQILRHGTTEFRKDGGFTLSVWDVDFSPDATKLATASEDGTARLWDANTGAELAVLNHDGPVYEVEFSPNGALIATASSDGTARLIDAVNGKEVAILRHEAAVNNVAFSPDGSYLVTGSADASARLWRVRLDDLVELACHILSRNLTQTEWERYLPGKLYRHTCPNLPLPETTSPTPSPALTPTTQPFVSPLPRSTESFLPFNSPLSTTPGSFVSPLSTPEPKWGAHD